MTEERQLHVFEGDEEWFVAYDAEDAWVVWAEFCGEKREDYDNDEGLYWTLCPDDAPRKILTEEPEDGYEPTGETKTNAEWATLNGRGYLCSRDW
jgi:hypothetical protein